MRRLVAVLGCTAVLGLAPACSVDVEGAACQTPGDRTVCPEGQACGNDLLCSKRAAACTLCLAGARSCRADDASHVYACSVENDPVCGKIGPADPCGDGQACDASATDATCRCDRFTVDPAGAAAGTTCRYAAITDALAAAQARLKHEVLLGGITGQAYGAAAADLGGIAIPDGMTLRGDDSPLAPAGRVVTAAGGGEGISLGVGSALRGLTLRRAASGPVVGVRVTGAGALDFVVVDSGGGGAFATGVLVEGSGAVTLTDSVVIGATAVGLDVARADGDQTVADARGLLKGNATGVRLQRGALSLQVTQIFGSSGPGLQAAPASGETARLSAKGATVARGTSVGLDLQNLAALDLEETQICANAGRSQTIAGVTRTAGGLLVLGNVATAPVVRANRLFGNGGDQLVIGGSGGTVWSLEAASCSDGGAAAPNVLAGYVSPGVGLSAIGASVAAGNVSWISDNLPQEGADYFRNPSGAVTITRGNYCGMVTPALSCPQTP
jgi:hypothetical protein